MDYFNRLLGSEPINFQWLRDGTAISNADRSALTLTSLKIIDSGFYGLVASNTVGCTTSLLASITVTAAPPVIIQQPVSTIVLAGQSANFINQTIGSTPLFYQWYFQSNALPDQNSNQLIVGQASENSAGSYFVVVTNAFGSVTSAVVYLTVHIPPTLLGDYTNQVVDAGQTVVLNPNISGTPPLTFSWGFNYTILSNTSPSLILTNIAVTQSGFYVLTVKNQYGTLSISNRVSVFPAPLGIVAWGDNSCDQTNIPKNLTNAVAIAGGNYHSVALRHDGTLFAWGLNDQGQLDYPTNSMRFVSIAARGNHNLAILENGAVVGWGLNDAGQTTIPSTVQSALSVAAGASHSLALLSSGYVVVWGDNSCGQLVLPDTLSTHSYWSYNVWKWITTYPDPVQAIAAGGDHSLALQGGKVVAWGDNSYGQSAPPAGLSNVVAIASGYLHSVALRADGTVVVWGDNTFGQTNMPTGLTNIIAIAAGNFHTIALRADGQILAWGDDSYQQTDLPSTLFNSFAIATGDYHCFALTMEPPRIQAQIKNGGLILLWQCQGTLQTAPTLSGPFRDVITGCSFTNMDMSAPAQFYRIKIR